MSEEQQSAEKDAHRWDRILWRCTGCDWMPETGRGANYSLEEQFGRAHEQRAFPPGASVMTALRWEAVDSDTSDLLAVLADDGTVPVDEQWDEFVENLRSEAIRSFMIRGEYLVNPNRLRSRNAGRIKPSRIGAFTHRALSQGLIEYTGNYVVSTDRKGRNSGKPCREMRWIG